MRAMGDDTGFVVSQWGRVLSEVITGVSEWVKQPVCRRCPPGHGTEAARVPGRVAAYTLELCEG